MKIKILSNGDDWQALYIDGEKVEESHSIRVRDAIEAITKKIGLEMTLEFEDSETFPERINDEKLR